MHTQKLCLKRPSTAFRTLPMFAILNRNLICAAVATALSCADLTANSLPSQDKPAWQSAQPPKTTSLLKATDALNTKKIDASTQQRLHDTFAEVLMSLDDQDQQMFAAAMATISVMVAEDKSEDNQKKLYDVIHGKTAEEIIAASRKLTPHIRKYSKIIDGTNQDTFNRSVGRIVVSLPIEMQTKFSEAIAKLIFQAQKDKIPAQQLYKKLDAKTPDEVIWMAEHVNLPFSIVNSSNAKKVETTISPLSKEEVEKYKKSFGDTTPDSVGKKEQSLDINLSPTGAFK